MTDLKGLTVSIYSNASYRKCAMGGVSETHDEVTIVGVIDKTTDRSSTTVIPLPRDSQVFRPSEVAPAAVLVKRRPVGGLTGPPLIHVEPLVHTRQGSPMFGGSYASSSDSRISKMIGFYGAVPVHDRVEH